MAIDDLRRDTFQNNAVEAQLLALTTDSVAAQFPSVLSRSEAASQTSHDWNYLLMVASLFAGSPHGSHADAALRVAQHCLVSGSTTPEQRAAAGIILESLGNSPALRLAIHRQLLPENYEAALPYFLRLQQTRCRLATSVSLSDSTPLRLNRFQHAFWTSLESAQWLSVSAPTSAGKSFAVTRWIIDTFSDNDPRLCVYLVPTRALIRQVENDLTSYAASKRRAVSISSIPRPASYKADRPNVLVFTQERLHLFLSSFGKNLIPSVDVMIVDEAQKVGDGQRGVVLQLVIEDVVSTNPDTTLVLISPMTANPSVLLADKPDGVKSHTLESEEVTVNQNLLWLSQKPRKPKLWEMSLCLDSETISLGTISLSSKPVPESKRLTFVAHALGIERPGTIIYVNGAADAEKSALQLFDLLGASADISSNPDIAHLGTLIEQVIHPQYVLRTVISRGVAFHYGNMPLIVRAEVERLFTEGVIRFLVCTSTLVEGVNTACKTICVRGPKKGRGQPMNAEDFWNLAGRAGRLGREFQGNIVCVDANRSELWENGEPPRRRAKYVVERTTDTVLLNPGELLDFINRGAPRDIAHRRPDLEYVSSYLMSCHTRYGALMNAPWVRRFDQTAMQTISEIVNQCWATIVIPGDVALRSPGFNPLAMQTLFQYFEDRTSKEGKPVEDLLPAGPGSSDAVESYTAVIGRCAQYLSASLGPTGSRSFVLALLVTRWMQGLPLARLVDERVHYWTKGKGSNSGRKIPEVPAIIRSVLEDVEKIARFEAPRAFSAYTDVLGVFLQTIQRDDLIEQLEDTAIYLELGVSIVTQISLMALGLSRATAIRISELTTDDEMTEEQCRDWLADFPFDRTDVPQLMRVEVERVLQNVR